MTDGPLMFPTLASWRRWLRQNRARERGVWVLVAKKGTETGIPLRAAVEEALCWGWIDGKLHRHDQRYFALWFAPRRPKSIWSESNRRAASRLIAEGRMMPAGLARVDEAKADGRWQRAVSARNPPRMGADVRRGLEAAGALAEFRALAPSRRTMLLYWIGDAKRPETRARRIAELPALVRERRTPGFAAS